MKKILFISLLTFASFVNATSEIKFQLNELDTNKYCVYEQKVYSLGAVKKMGEVHRECRYFGNKINNIEPGARWSNIK